MSKISQINKAELELKAINFIKTFNEKKRISKAEAIYHYGEFLREKIENPVRMGIAMRDVLEREPITDMFTFSNNIAYIEQEKGIKDLLNKYENQESNYSKLSDIRTKLIKEKRVNHDKVTPNLKGFDKFKLRLKLIFS